MSKTMSKKTKKSKKSETQIIAATTAEFATKYPVETIRGRYIPISPREANVIPEEYFPLMFCIYDSKLPLDPVTDYANHSGDIADYVSKDTMLICVLPSVPLPPKNEIQQLMHDKGDVLRTFTGLARTYAALVVGHNHAMQKVRAVMKAPIGDAGPMTYEQFAAAYMQDIPLPK